MRTNNFQELLEVLRDLSLSEADFAAGDAVVDRVANFKQAVNRLDTSDGPWVGAWLAAEHLKAGTLYAAAKTNWSKEQADGAGVTFNSRTRAAIVSRFNDWVNQCRSRLDAYERSARTSADVAQWRAGLDRFREDPVHNP
jgi:hypothetical protein